MSERRQPPSARRLRRAREEGRVAFSPEPAGVLALACLALFGFTSTPRAHLEGLGHRLLSEPLSLEGGLLLSMETLGLLLLPWLALLGLGGAVLGGIQTRGLLTLHPLRPDPSRLSLARGWQRLFGLDRLATPLRGLLLTSLALPLFGWVGAELFRSLCRLAGRSAGPALLPSLLGPVVWTGLALLLLSATVDLSWRRHRHARALRMTDQERKDEARQEQGDPQARQQRRGQHRQLALQAPPTLAEARVVVLNPTHLAIALHHDHLDQLPYRGRIAAGRPAGRLRAEARQAGVPLLRDKPLARALFRLEEGEEIPPALYAPVAALLAGVYRAGLATPPPSRPSPPPWPSSGDPR